MSRIRVNTEIMECQREQMEKVQQILRSVSSDVSCVNRNLSWNISSREQIKATLSTYTTYVDVLQKKTGGLSTTLQLATEQYKDAEKKVGAIAVGNSDSKNDNKNQTNTEKESLWSWSDTWKTISKGGIIGALIAAIGQWITGGVSFTNVFKTLKHASSFVENLSKSVSDASFDWKRLFGFDTPGKKTWQSELDKLKFSNAEELSEKVSVGAKWAGYICTALITGYDNFTDPDNTTFERKIAETVGETSVKLLETMALSVLLSTVGAPAVVAGVGTVIISWAGDYFSKMIFGKDVAELVSDTVIDTVNDTVNVISEGISKLTGAITKKIGEIFGGWWNHTPQISGGSW